MSGIIDSAGSRSGVIGTTELDYEEGSFPCGLDNSADDGTFYVNSGYTLLAYTKIGRLVQIQGYIQAYAATGCTGTIEMTGLPFLPADIPIPAGHPGAGTDRPDFNPIYVHCRGTGSTDLIASGIVTPNTTYIQLEFITAADVQAGTGFYVTGSYTTNL